jgi:hypothetical protein
MGIFDQFGITPNQLIATRIGFIVWLDKKMHVGFSLATAAPWLPIALPLGALHFTLSADA